MSLKRILIIDDEDNIRKYLKYGFEAKGHAVNVARSGEEFMRLFADRASFDLIILDLNLPDISGMEVLQYIKNNAQDSHVIIITAYGEIRSVVEAMRSGASDYITKPFELEEIELAAERVFTLIDMKKEISVLRYQMEQRFYEDMIGVSRGMIDVFDMIEKISKSSTSTVLVMGESGTGKELAARAIHNKSERNKNPFVAINCTAIHESLLESELFGHEKGAFTDAGRAKQGLFEIADGGTVFLDEIGDMDLKLQAKLLRFLEDHSFRRVGGVSEIGVDIRVIASTNRDLEREIKLGTFREDLYYRLKVIPVVIPPLRERKDDIPFLVEHFVDKFCKETGKRLMGVDEDALKALMEYDWPGNVRELRNLIERVVILGTDSSIRVKHLPMEIVREDAAGLLSEIGSQPELFADAKRLAISRFERNYIVSLLSKNSGNVSKSAREAGMDRGSFSRLMRKYGITSKVFGVN